MFQINSKLSLILSAVLALFIQSSFASAGTNDEVSIQNSILVHINHYRQQHGKNPLRMDPKITTQAKQHSSDMANHKMSFGHQDFLKRIKTLHSQIKNSGAAAENVAYNYKNAEIVVQNWLKSPGHKANIDGNYDLTGIGVVRDAHGKLYFTQIFLKSGQKIVNVRRYF